MIPDPKNKQDWIFEPDEDHVWIGVRKFSINLRLTDEGVVVDVYRLGREMEDSIASTYAFDDECEMDDEEEI